jgi:antitoxin ParD1/3/4
VAEIHKISVSLPADQVTALRAAVEAGEYATASEVVRAALRDWQLKRERRLQECDRLRQLWDAGKASGKPAPLDFDGLKAEAQRRPYPLRKPSRQRLRHDREAWEDNAIRPFRFPLCFPGAGRDPLRS